MAKFRLAGVLRARQAQEGVAKVAAARARVEAEQANADVHRYAATLDAAAEVHPDTATALAAAMSARQAVAGALFAAIGVFRDADEAVEDRMAELTAAAAQRRAMDKLAERHAVTRRRNQDAAEQRELDDLATARHSARRPVGSFIGDEPA
jgi:flagellar FliJ protein